MVPAQELAPLTVSVAVSVLDETVPVPMLKAVLPAFCWVVSVVVHWPSCPDA